MTVLLQTGLIWLIVVESAKTGNREKIGSVLDPGNSH